MVRVRDWHRHLEIETLTLASERQAQPPNHRHQLMTKRSGLGLRLISLVRVAATGGLGCSFSFSCRYSFSYSCWRHCCTPNGTSSCPIESDNSGFGRRFDLRASGFSPSAELTGSLGSGGARPSGHLEPRVCGRICAPSWACFRQSRHAMAHQVGREIGQKGDVPTESRPAGEMARH